MNKRIMLFIVLGLFLVGCSSSLPLSSPPSVLDSCELPAEFAIQSNCPFAAAMIDGECRIFCAVFNEESEQGEAFSCTLDSQCDCSSRGDSSQECVCFEGNCVSIEG